MGTPRYIVVTGYFSSGSSAVVDLLKEFAGAYECQAEIKIIDEPYGIHQLEYNLTEEWDLLTSAAAIRDFLWLCKICNRKLTKFPFAPAGLGYAENINKHFFQISKEYIESISDYKYKSDYYYQKFKKNYLRYIVDRCRFGIEHYTKGALKVANRCPEDSYFSKPSKDLFYRQTKKYFDELFRHFFDRGTKFVILDQAVSTMYPDKIDDYFNNAKMIIVDRDPRDMYVEDIVKWGENLDKDVASEAAGLRYVNRYKALHSVSSHSPNVFRICFEDLVTDYNNSLISISSFLSIDISEHVSPQKYLVPEKSRRNVGIWKKYYKNYQGAIDAIGKELAEYCFDKNGD